MYKTGIVYLVGGGPGDPDLITLKGLRCLQRAEVVVYDKLIPRQLLERVPPDAELIYAGKEPGRPTPPQEEINAILIDRAEAGKRVVRLKGGDPFVFGRGGEEAQELTRAGIPFEVVPGVSSAVAAPAYAGIPVTHRNLTSTVTIVTGHEDPAKERAEVDYGALARLGGTLVFLMGVKRLGEIAESLMAGGLSPRTPVAVMEQGCTPAQRVVEATLATVAEEARRVGVRPPAVTVVGAVASLRWELNWFEGRPLFGRRIVVTRAREQASAFAQSLQEAGAEVVEYPIIRLAPPASWRALDEAIAHLGDFDWLIFTSANGARSFGERLERAGLDARALGGARLCAIGPATAGALRERLALRADRVPKVFRAEGILESFADGEVAGRRFLIVRAEEAREVLPEELRRRGAQVEVVPAYRTLQAGGDAEGRERLRRDLREGKVDMVTFTSSSTVRNFLERLGGEPPERAMPGVAVACIGPITARTAEEAGLHSCVQPEEYTIPAFVRAIVDFYRFGVTPR
ncbi:MAG: uroporphyrinogen-III C-methyltransferase [Nitrospinota bacterium]